MIIPIGGLLAVMAGVILYFYVQSPSLPFLTLEAKARVIRADNSEVHSSGLSHIGYQILEIQILDTRFKGKNTRAVKSLNGQVPLENLFAPHDTIIAALILNPAGNLQEAKAVDLYRQDSLSKLFVLFVAALILYAGVVGIKALISFILSIFIIWEVLVRQILAGAPPLLTTALTIVVLSGLIIFMVAGMNRKGVTAFIGTITGLVITLGVTLYFSKETGLFGMTQPYVNGLIFSGYHELDIRQIFYSAIILGASGAAMDISAAMAEIQIKKPEIRPKELIQSGFTVGRQVIGTMTTTLLLAYSGGYLTLLMLFKVKDLSFTRMINLKIVAAEILRTLIGSVGLVMVAPITALVGGIIMANILKNKSISS
ncbi:MAG: YibE/F family protein [Desulfobacter sp.]|nr:MAG: YibE/F family protein [Desulfobacter sp.]